MRSRMMARFGGDFINQRAEAEADQIGAKFSHAGSPAELKAQMGEALGADFSAVRFHMGPDAAAMAEASDANAFASGRDIYMGAGGFNASIAAHEMVHTAQQGAVEASAPLVSAPAGAVQYNKFTKWVKKKKAEREAKKAPGKRAAAANRMQVAVGNNQKAYNELSTKDQKKVDIMRKVRGGDLSKYAKLSKYDQQELINERRPVIMNWLMNTATLPGKTRAQSIANVRAPTAKERLDPLTRAAMSQIANEKDSASPLRKEDRKVLYEVGEELDKQMLIDTMKRTSTDPTNNPQRDNLIQHYTNKTDLKFSNQEYEDHSIMKPLFGKDELSASETKRQMVGTRTPDEAARLADRDINQANAQGEAMLRMMFLMQLGDFQEDDGNGVVKPWEHNIANALSHGGRTAFTFNQRGINGDNVTTEDLLEKVFGPENATGRHVRDAGTHHLVTKDKADGQFKEEKGIDTEVVAAFDKQYKHYGMDMPIGGVGQKGLNDKVITNDGRNGHMYIGRLENEGQQGGFLVGLETDSPYHTNSSGHTHTASATAAPTSSTGGLKDDRQGSDKGGRFVNLNGFQNQELMELLDDFTAHFRNLDEERYNNLLEMMAGKRMGREQMQSFLSSIKFNKNYEEYCAERRD